MRKWKHAKRAALRLMKKKGFPVAAFSQQDTKCKFPNTSEHGVAQQMRWTVYEGKMSKCVTQVSPKSNCLLGSQGVRNMRTREASKRLSPTALNPLLLSERRTGNVHYRHSASQYCATRKIELGNMDTLKSTLTKTQLCRWGALQWDKIVCQMKSQCDIQRQLVCWNVNITVWNDSPRKKTSRFITRQSIHPKASDSLSLSKMYIQRVGIYKQGSRLFLQKEVHIVIARRIVMRHI